MYNVEFFFWRFEIKGDYVLWCIVQGLEFRVQGLTFRVHGLGFGVRSSGFGVYMSNFDK